MKKIVKKNIKKNKEVELTNTIYNLKINDLDDAIDKLLDNLDYLEWEYSYHARTLDTLYNKYDIYVKKNNKNPTLILCENIIEIEKNICVYEKKFIEVIGELSKNKLEFELIIDKYYKSI